MGGQETPRRGIVQILWARRLIILITTLLTVVGAAIYVTRATRIYYSGARILVQQNNPRIISNDETRESNSKNNLNTECELIRSTPILAAALESPGIRALRTFSEVAGPLPHMSRSLKVATGMNHDLITVGFESKYPDDIPNIVNAIIDSYISFQSTRRRNTTAEVLKILQKEKVKRDAELTEAHKRLLEFKRQKPELGFKGERGNIIVQRLDRLSTALTEAELAMVEAKADFDALQAMKDDPAKVQGFFEANRATGKIIVGVQDEDMQLTSELNLLKARLTEMKRDYSGDSSSVKSIEERIAKVQQDIKERQSNTASMQLAVVQQRFQSTNERLARITTAYSQQLAEAQKLNEAIVEHVRMENACEQARKLVEVLDARVKELNITEGVGALNISTIEPAGRPEKPIKPDKARIVLVCFAIGLILGGCLAMLRDWLDARIASAKEVQDLLNVPVLALLPEIKKKRTEALSTERLVLEFPRSPMAEAYRGLRTTLSFGVDSKIKVILVTSSEAGEGKSTVLSNLGITFAQSGRRTLLLDADFRRGCLHSVYKIPNEIGLSSLLNEVMPVDLAIQSGGLAHLDVLPSGPVPDNPYELLNSPKFATILRELSSRYDCILIDSPPVMMVADSLVLAANSDSTLLVVRANRSHRSTVDEACKALIGVGADVCGTIFNESPIRKGRYSYFEGYDSTAKPEDKDQDADDIDSDAALAGQERPTV